MLDSVTISAPARLHLGFLDIDGALGRRFGSLGLAIERPFTRLALAPAQRTTTAGPESERAAAHLAVMKEALGLAGHYELRIEAAIPSHCGLGSGTQLALAVAAAVRRLNGLPLDSRGDAERLGRGLRSGVGIGLFERGGLVIDGGRTQTSGPAPIVARLRFWEDWRIILVHDPEARGKHGEAEARAFADLPPFSPERAAHLCHVVVMRALPGLVERDLDGFGAAIAEIQTVIGEHFAPVQGGRFASHKVARAMELLAAAGAKGIGQSSWGPTGFAFAASAAEAQRLKEAVVSDTPPGGLAIDVVRSNNRGAVIETAARARADAPRHLEHP